MRVADWAVRAVVIATFFALLVAPERWGFPLGLISLGIVGTWALLYPQGPLGWAKTAHPSIDVDDRSLWWLPRLIGGFFVAGALMFVFFGFRATPLICVVLLLVGLVSVTVGLLGVVRK